MINKGKMLSLTSTLWNYVQNKTVMCSAIYLLDVKCFKLPSLLFGETCLHAHNIPTPLLICCKPGVTFTFYLHHISS
jgi:hypothetical protein